MESITSLPDPKLADMWTITTPSEIEYYLMLRNRLHFGQAEGTPFTIPPLSQDIDWEATTPLADSLLDGTYTFESTVPNCVDLLQACKKRSALDSLPDELSEREFKGKIQAWRESRASILWWPRAD